jgi:adenosylcobyric acid synthase
MLAGGHGLQCVAPGLAWADASGRVLGLYWHGLFEDPSVLQALFGAATPTLDHVFDHLADTLTQHSLPGALDALIQP